MRLEWLLIASCSKELQFVVGLLASITDVARCINVLYCCALFRGGLLALSPPGPDHSIMVHFCLIMFHFGINDFPAVLVL